MDGMFNFLIGAIDISNSSTSFYDVYATGITMNGLDVPTAIAGSTRNAFNGLIACTESTTFLQDVPNTDIKAGDTVANKDILGSTIYGPCKHCNRSASYWCWKSYDRCRFI